MLEELLFINNLAYEYVSNQAVIYGSLVIINLIQNDNEYFGIIDYLNFTNISFEYFFKSPVYQSFILGVSTYSALGFDLPFDTLMKNLQF